MRTIGITGISGFIAGHVAEECIKRGYKVIGLDHIKREAHEYPEGVEIFLGDMRDEAAMMELAAHSDGILHLAGVLGTQECVKNPLPAIDSNIKGGLNFLEACNQYDIPGVNIAVGNYYMNNPYSISKNMIERLCYMYNNDRGGRINQVRAVNCYGPRQTVASPFGSSKVRKITPSFVCRALTNMPIEIYGDGQNISDMVYVGDVAKALVNALEYADRGITFNESIECGPKEHHAVKEVAELIIKLSGSKSEIVHLPMRPGEQAGVDVTANFDTLKQIGMDVDELTSLEQGMTKTIGYFKNYLHETGHFNSAS